MYCPGFQYEYEQLKLGSVKGVESIAFPFHCAVMPGKIGSSWARYCPANFATCELVLVVEYGFR